MNVLLDAAFASPKHRSWLCKAVIGDSAPACSTIATDP
jgi:hypothetical protein